MFLTKNNQIVDCPDAEALAAFKHSVRDEWLPRHLGQEKPRTMASLTSLMTRFCAGEDGKSATPVHPKLEMETGNHGATAVTNAGIKKTARRARQ